MKLDKVRPCDGACCIASPRFPNKDGTDCIYRTEPNAEKGCSLMADTSPIVGKISPAQPDMTAVECFELTCRNFPENTRQKIGQTGDCCWEWTE